MLEYMVKKMKFPILEKVIRIAYKEDCECTFEDYKSSLSFTHMKHTNLIIELEKK